MAVKYYIQYFDSAKVERSLEKSNIIDFFPGKDYTIGDIVYLTQVGVTDQAYIQVTALGSKDAIADFEVLYGGSGYANEEVGAECETNPSGALVTKFVIRDVAQNGIEHYITIDVPDFEGASTRVGGKVTLNYSETDSNLEAIRGNALTVELEADTDLTFSDLWDVEEKTVKVVYTRAGTPLFSGFLNPEGFFENWVSTNWMISFDCVDGLGYLENLSYVDENGLPITGYKSQIETLAIALKRTGLQQDIYTSINIRYVGLANSLDPLENVYVNSARYIKEDDSTIMDCDAVIRDILEPYGAVLTSLFGVWFIYKPNQVYLSPNIEYYTYDYLGGPKGGIPAINFSINIGSGFYNPIDNSSNTFGIGILIHCSENQRISNVASLGAYRVSYEYGLVAGFDENNNLITYDGVTVPKWTIVDNTNLVLAPVGEGGIYLTSERNDPSGPVLNVEQFKSNGITFPLGSIADITIRMSYEIVGGLETSGLNFDYVLQATFTTDTTTYYLRSSDAAWVTSVEFIKTGIRSNGGIFGLIPQEFPDNGDLVVHIWTPQNISTRWKDREVKVKTESVVVSLPANAGENTLIGEFHTVQRISKPSAKIHKVKEVATGDNSTDLYEGTMLQSDGETPTEAWTRKGMNEEKPLLQIMGEEHLRMSANTARIFSGSVYGFFPYLSVISINGLDGLYMPIKYSYDTVNNIVTGEYKQIFGDELEGDIDYKPTYNNNGNVVTPTII